LRADGEIVGAYVIQSCYKPTAELHRLREWDDGISNDKITAIVTSHVYLMLKTNELAGAVKSDASGMEECSDVSRIHVLA
jgi:hypothetical protein